MVKTLLRWTLLTSTIATVTIGLNLAMSGYSVAQPEILALKSDQTMALEGTASGPKRDKTCAGFIAKEANHYVKINQASNLNFTLEGAEDATLLIIGKDNQRFCVQADPVSKGKITIPGRWSTGQYEVFIGSRSGNKSAYKLTIGPLEI
ncbi:hypothetical protein IQ266_20565 [filamentous cyanobacterium LEGE 11480]|uniref:Uncharacterized protein n=1 Tax=Romeriopsis navalis LEGE 11480 TaxID=2777977 RepID=A0A928VP67_9CYAN|nr:hypothetical protein [Romeriopsis navalis]MBE9032136.1 hypothetical protein [Romeriopsis navalis LEGE 11480]